MHTFIVLLSLTKYLGGRLPDVGFSVNLFLTRAERSRKKLYLMYMGFARDPS
jgi:hypothetical protein